jgi:hypothetical protein
MALVNVPTFVLVGYPLGVVPAPISDIGPVGPVRAGGGLLATELLAPPPALEEEELTVLAKDGWAGAGELAA